MMFFETVTGCKSFLPPLIGRMLLALEFCWFAVGLLVVHGYLCRIVHVCRPSPAGTYPADSSQVSDVSIPARLASPFVSPLLSNLDEV